MTKMNRFLALIPVVAFAAACNGVAPTGPDQMTSNQPDEALSGNATATALPCPTLTSIDLARVTDGPNQYVWVEATYRYSSPAAQRCRAPKWTSDRNQMVVDRNNPMRAGFLRAAGGHATLTATAPNRVTNFILVTIGPVSRDDSSTIVPIPEACRAITGVNVKITPNPGISREVSLVTSYTYTSPIAGVCTFSPAWTASRTGLIVNATNPFRASIGRQVGVQTTVTSNAPNGISGNIRF
jgi:hypothetical protein